MNVSAIRTEPASGTESSLAGLIGRCCSFYAQGGWFAIDEGYLATDAIVIHHWPAELGARAAGSDCVYLTAREASAGKPTSYFKQLVGLPRLPMGAEGQLFRPVELGQGERQRSTVEAVGMVRLHPASFVLSVAAIDLVSGVVAPEDVPMADGVEIDTAIEFTLTGDVRLSVEIGTSTNHNFYVVAASGSRPFDRASIGAARRTLSRGSPLMN